MARDPELETFKTEIDLREFAASVGFVANIRESWRGSAVMEFGQADRIIITRDADGHYIYFSVKQNHAGTIIDLARMYVNRNLGEVRKALRAFEGSSQRVVSPPLEKTFKDFGAVASVWHAARVYERHLWLERDRGITSSLLTSDRFAGRTKIDQRGNVLFAHSDLEGHLCGFEKKNRGFTGFAAGGEKGLGCSHDFNGDQRIVFAESFIDMLSYAALFPDTRTRYRSFGGGLNTKQPEIIRAHILALPRGSEVVAATDGDEAGRAFADKLEKLADGYVFIEDRPPSGDWNDVLRSASLPTALPANTP